MEEGSMTTINATQCDRSPGETIAVNTRSLTLHEQDFIARWALARSAPGQVLGMTVGGLSVGEVPWVEYRLTVAGLTALKRSAERRMKRSARRVRMARKRRRGWA